MPVVETASILGDPNVAYVLLLVGLLGIGLEIFSPGTVVPGVIGAIALTLGIIGATELPVEAIGVVLLVAGLLLLIAEAHLPTAGLLGLLGVAALVAGGLLIFDGDGEGVDVNPVLVIVSSLLLAGGLLFIGRKAMEVRNRPFLAGEEELVGELADVRARLDPYGQVFVNGALWRAEVDPAKAPVEPGNTVRVVDVDGLTLMVEPTGEASGKGREAAPNRFERSVEGSEKWWQSQS